MDVETPEAPTLKDIAREAGVSVAAVSKVLNNRTGVGAETRERITRIARDLGYRGRGGRADARGLDSATILTLDRYVMNDAFYGAIISGLLSSGADASMDIRVSVTPRADKGSIATLYRDAPPKALILVGLDAPGLVDEVVALGCPAVIVNGMDRTMRLPSVSPDYHFGAWSATNHLLDLGHRDIVHVTHPYRQSITRRIDGLRNALEEAGIGFDPDRNLLDLGSPDLMTAAAGNIFGDWLEKRDRLPDAIFCVNDIVALGVLQELQSRGISVPQDISVMGFDGLPIGAHSTPPLTTMKTDREALGRIAVDLLIGRAERPDQAVERVTLGVHLEDRESTSFRRIE